MPYYEKEQIARAREMDLLTYLQQYEPNEFIHDGGNIPIPSTWWTTCGICRTGSDLSLKAA
jgi:hypothetical protein